MPNKQRVLIIGGSSFVARNFIRMQKDYYNIKTIVRTSSGFKNELVISDFANLSNEIFSGIDAVINCAAIVHKNKEIAEEIYNKINFELALDLAKKAKNSGIKTFIQLSTIAVYGNVTHITENSNENPINFYGKSKLLADNALKNMANNNFNVVIIRPPMVYGNTDAPGNMMRLIKLISKGFPLPFKKTTNKRDFIHVNNLVGFLDASIKKNSTGVFLVSDNSPVYISELYETITSCLGKQNRAFTLPAICFKTIKKIIPGIYDKLFGNLTIDATSTIQNLDFIPKILIKEGISEMVSGLKKNIKK